MKKDDKTKKIKMISQSLNCLTLQGRILGLHHLLDGVVIFNTTVEKRECSLIGNVSEWLGDLGTVFKLTLEHFIYKKERPESRLMEIDIEAMDKPDLHELKFN